MPEITIPAENQRKTHDAQDRMALREAPLEREDIRLQNLLANWENLPEPIKAAIMAMVASLQGQLR